MGQPDWQSSQAFLTTSPASSTWTEILQWLVSVPRDLVLSVMFVNHIVQCLSLIPRWRTTPLRSPSQHECTSHALWTCSWRGRYRVCWGSTDTLIIPSQSLSFVLNFMIYHGAPDSLRSRQCWTRTWCDVLLQNWNLSTNYSNLPSTSDHWTSS